MKPVEPKIVLGAGHCCVCSQVCGHIGPIQLCRTHSREHWPPGCPRKAPCDREYNYDDRRCIRGEHPGWETHESADGFRWSAHEELVGLDEVGHEVWDIWDEPVQ